MNSGASLLHKESSDNNKPGTCYIKTEVLDYQYDSPTENQTGETFNCVEIKTEPEVQDCMKLEVVDEYINYIEPKTELKYEADANLKEENVDEFRCGHCDYISKTKAALEVHRHERHPETTMFTCKQCDFVTDTQITFERHVIIVHEQPTKLKCDFCPYKSEDRRCLLAHLTGCHGKIRHNCSYCDFSSRRKMSVRRHEKRLHLGKDVYKCLFCTWTSFSGSALKVHMRQEHNTG